MMSELTTTVKLAAVRTTLAMLQAGGARHVSLNLDSEWWHLYAFVLGVQRVSFGAYSDGTRYMQRHGGESNLYGEMRVSLSTDRIPDDVPATEQEGYIVQGFCPDCGDLTAVLAATLQEARYGALAFGLTS